MTTLPTSTTGRPEVECHGRSYTAPQLALFESTAPHITYIEHSIETQPLRRCGTCRIHLPTSAFPRRALSADGFAHRCLACNRALQRLLRSVHPDDAWLQPATGERCEICDGDGGGRVLCFDHDHITGRFRGWLCNGCNSAIGHLQDNPELLRRAITYLELANR